MKRKSLWAMAVSVHKGKRNLPQAGSSMTCSCSQPKLGGTEDAAIIFLHPHHTHLRVLLHTRELSDLQLGHERFLAGVSNSPPSPGNFSE